MVTVKYKKVFLNMLRLILPCIFLVLMIAGCSNNKGVNTAGFGKTLNSGIGVPLDKKSDITTASGKVIKFSGLSFKSDDGKIVRLGMKKTDLIFLYRDNEERKFVDTYEGREGFFISFKNDIVNYISYDEQQTGDIDFKYTFYGNIKIGDRKSDVLKIMGNPSKNIIENSNSTHYFYKVNDENAEFIEDEKYVQESSAEKYIDVIFEYTNSVNDDERTLLSITALYVNMD